MVETDTNITITFVKKVDNEMKLNQIKSETEIEPFEIACDICEFKTSKPSLLLQYVKVHNQM